MEKIFLEELQKHGYSIEEFQLLPEREKKYLLKIWKDLEVEDENHIVEEVATALKKEQFFNWLKNSEYHNLIVGEIRI